MAKAYIPYDGSAGIYSSVEAIPDSREKLQAWSSKLAPKLARRTNPDDFHCTVIWSKVSPNRTDVDPKMDYLARLDHFEYWDGHDKDGYLVAVLTSPSLLHRHKQWKSRGAVSSFPDYCAHVTLADKFTPTPDLFKQIVQLSDKYRGQVLSFTNETIENTK